MENLGTGEWIVIGLSLIIGLFFVIGNWINNQRGNDAMRWLRRGLSRYGELQSSRFNAPSSKGIPIQIVPSEQGPFQQIRGNLVLERRENLPLWLFQQIAGKKDTLFWTSNLQEAPVSDIHIVEKSFLPKIKPGKAGISQQSDQAIPIDSSPYYLLGDVSPAQVERISQGISQLPPVIQEIKLQRKSPQLAFQARLSPLLQSDPESFFQSLKKWIEAS